MSEAEGRAPALNALKHGILAKAVVVHGGLASESLETQREFDALLSDLLDHYRPVGPVEEMLVEQIAVNYWRQRRVLWAEAAQCATRVANAALEAVNATEDWDDEAADLEDEADAVRKRGRLTKKEREAYGPHATAESVALRLKAEAARKLEESEQEFTRRTQFHSAPAFTEQLDIRSRYETHLVRQLHKSIKLLEEMQAARGVQRGAQIGKKRKTGSRGRQLNAGLRVVAGGRR